MSLVRFRQRDRAVGSAATVLRQSLRQTQDRVLWVDADVGRVLLTLRGHTGEVACVRFSPDGRQIVGGAGDGMLDRTRDGTVHVWDATTGDQLQSFPQDATGLLPNINSVSYGPDGARLFAGGSDGKLAVWNVQTGDRIQELDAHEGAILSVATSPSGSVVATASADKTVKLWDTDRGKQTLAIRGFEFEVVCVAFSSDGMQIATADGPSIKVWDAHSGRQSLVIRAEKDEEKRRKPPQFSFHRISGMKFSPAGDRLIASLNNGCIGVWEAQSGDNVRFLVGHDSLSVNDVDVSPDGSRVVSGADDGTLRVWNLDSSLDTDEVVRQVPSPGVSNLALSPDGRQVLGRRKDGVLLLTNIDTGEEISKYDGHRQGSTLLTSVTFSLNGRMIASGVDGGVIKIWRAADGEEDVTIHTGAQQILALTFTPDGGAPISSESHVDGKSHGQRFKLNLWDTKTGMKVRELESVTDHSIRAIEFHPKQPVLATGSSIGIKIWDGTGKVVKTLKGHSGRIQSIRFNEDGSKLVSGSADRTIKVWDLSSNEQAALELTGHGAPITSVALNSSGSRVVGVGREKLTVWDSKSGEKLLSLRSPGSTVSNIRFSTDGKTLIGLSGENLVRWEGNKRQEFVKTIHGGDVRCVKFSPDGTLFATVSSNELINLWDLRSRDLVTTIAGHDDEILDLAFDSDGSRIVSGSRDGSIRVWTVQDGREVLGIHGTEGDGYISAVEFMCPSRLTIRLASLKQGKRSTGREPSACCSCSWNVFNTWRLVVPWMRVSAIEVSQCSR